ncbi:MAG: hypothetical protein U9N57_09210 [Pseudomonadota bacterium]|nr:hypothetical protein [Pseudomonadota bacterium]
MITEVWLHRFNDNELGISEGGTGRGAFVLVPKDARKLLPPLSEVNEFKTTVNVYVNKELLGDNNYSKPPSKSEYRLSLAGISEYSDQGESLSGGQSVVIHDYDGGINISTDLPNETIEPYLREFSSRTPHNNTVLSITHEVTGSTGDVVKNTLSKPFILLAGISGTGKSRFVRKQAATWQGTDNFELVAVRPDWHEPSDLLGYTLRLNDKPKFVVTPVLKFMVKAWLAALESSVTLSNEDSKTIATYNEVSPPPPFWLCLDEMNLAPVEQYFADYLAIIETREWNGNKYSCQPILKADAIQEADNMKAALGLDSGEANAEILWNHIQQHGLAIPFNLIVAGTVNMDETTHGFSRKVIDRALSLDFGEFAPNNFEEFFIDEDKKPQFKTLTYPTISQATTNDDNAQKTVAFLQAINSLLEGTLFEIAYRALNECLLTVECVQPANEITLQAVWDDFLMMKILPRIEGDEDKLASPNTDDDNLFIALEKVLEEQLNKIWNSKRPDLLRDNAPEIECRSRAKITRMKNLLENGFTSFWP